MATEERLYYLHSTGKALVIKIREEAEQLERWADESLSSGWSTHQVEPMRRRAAELRAFASRFSG